VLPSPVQLILTTLLVTHALVRNGPLAPAKDGCIRTVPGGKNISGAVGDIEYIKLRSSLVQLQLVIGERQERLEDFGARGLQDHGLLLGRKLDGLHPIPELGKASVAGVGPNSLVKPHKRKRPGRGKSVCLGWLKKLTGELGGPSSVAEAQDSLGPCCRLSELMSQHYAEGLLGKAPLGVVFGMMNGILHVGCRQAAPARILEEEERRPSTVVETQLLGGWQTLLMRPLGEIFATSEGSCEEKRISGRQTVPMGTSGREEGFSSMGVES
jgi:hypothetical protein